MTIKQKQCLLCYLGCYDGTPDGIWGQRSIEGTRQFQLRWGLEPDGIFGPATRRAVEAAQRRFNLPQTGIVDNAMLDLLYADNAPVFDLYAPLTQGDIGLRVRDLQQQLYDQHP